MSVAPHRETAVHVQLPSPLAEVSSEEPARFEAIWSLMTEKQWSMRTAAYIHGLGRIGEVIEAHGTREYFAGE